MALKAVNGRSLSHETSSVTKKSAFEYEVSVNDYGQTYGNAQVVRLSCVTDEKVSDIKNIEFYIPKGYKGKYVLQAGEKLTDEWLLHVDAINTVDEDVTVVLKVTFRNGRISYDHAVFKIRNSKIYFDTPELSLEEDYGVTKDEYGVYHTTEGNPYNGVGNFYLGVSCLIPRIKNSIKFVSSDESVITAEAQTVQSGDIKSRKFYVKFHAAGVAVLTAKATDDSGVEVSQSITISVDPTEEGE